MLAFLVASELPLQFYDVGTCGPELLVRSEGRVGRRRGFVFWGGGLPASLRRTGN